jgi:hypothetical protein
MDACLDMNTQTWVAGGSLELTLRARGYAGRPNAGHGLSGTSGPLRPSLAPYSRPSRSPRSASFRERPCLTASLFPVLTSAFVSVETALKGDVHASRTHLRHIAPRPRRILNGFMGRPGGGQNPVHPTAGPAPTLLRRAAPPFTRRRVGTTDVACAPLTAGLEEGGRPRRTTSQPTLADHTCADPAPPT